MGLLSRLFNFTAGTAIDSEQVDAEFNQILALLNGNLDSANLKDGAVDLVDLTAAVKNNFAKLITPADIGITFGVATVVGAPGSLGGIVHGHPRTPQMILTAAQAAGVHDAYAEAGQITATTFAIATGAVTPTGANVPVGWVAIG